MTAAATPCYEGLAFSDPSVSIDPAFLAQDPGATLEFSPNIQQFTPAAGSVPETFDLGAHRARFRRARPSAIGCEAPQTQRGCAVLF
jgi:hypothetical protein